MCIKLSYLWFLDPVCIDGRLRLVFNGDSSSPIAANLRLSSEDPSMLFNLALFATHFVCVQPAEQYNRFRYDGARDYALPSYMQLFELLRKREAVQCMVPGTTQACTSI